MKRLLLGLTLVLLASCGGLDSFGPDLDDFEPMPRLEDLDFSRVTPTGNPQYWELRFSFGPGSGVDRIVGAGGTRSRAELGPAINAALDSIRIREGWARGCLPGACFKFIAAVDTQVRVYNTQEALRAFLGAIETKEEAALLIDAHGFRWDEGQVTGVRKVGSAFEFVVLQLVKFCAPVQTDRVHVRVSADGTLRELDREVYQSNKNACI